MACVSPGSSPKKSFCKYLQGLQTSTTDAHLDITPQLRQATVWPYHSSNDRTAPPCVRQITIIVVDGTSHTALERTWK